LVGLFILSFYIPALQSASIAVFVVFILFFVIDYSLLFFTKKNANAERLTAHRFSNGDENKIDWIIKNEFKFPVSITVIDELPEQLQMRNWKRKLNLKARQQKKISWKFTPLERGEYHFGDIHLFVSSPLQLVSRRFTTKASETILVYPAFLQLRNYELFSGTALNSESGNQRMRKMGQSMEFEQIKEYVSGDDIRTLNWKARNRCIVLSTKED
jgi:uncharacterized protein (DUF58 family)